MLEITQTHALLSLYAVPLVAIWTAYIGIRRRKESRSLATLTAAREAGLDEPASLHPVIDPVKCLGCGACLRACPEGEVLGMIAGKAVLVEPANCIGHGACKASCPRDAITLVFGTQTRGVDIPLVSPEFETNVPGIYIAGELGGMGLIRNAVEQGRQAMRAIEKRRGSPQAGVLDTLIVGAGPAGISASLAALDSKLTFVTIEQDSLGGTVAQFPRGKLVMTQPAELPIVGRMPFREVSKEDLIAFWQGVIAKTGLKVGYGERVEGIAPHASGFAVTTTRQTYVARTVLLAIGRRGTPRKLGAPGEEQAKVVYRMIDPEQYRGQAVLVVGGGDSALEAAAEIADQPGTRVTLSYRGDGFSRAKAKNRDRVTAAVKAKRIALALGTTVRQIGPDFADLDNKGRVQRIANDAVIVCAGGVLPTGFLKSIGVEVETKYGTA